MGVLSGIQVQKGISRKFQMCFKDVARVFQWSFKWVTWVFRIGSIGVLGKLQRCFKTVSSKF